MAEAVLAAPSVIGANAYAAAEAEKDKPTRAPKPPDDFDSAQEFLQFIRHEYAKDLEYDQINRDEMKTDTEFLAGDQWDDSVKARRNASSKPTLTINRLPAYVAQLVGNRRLNDTGIKVLPDAGGDKKVANIREGLIRSIQKISKAQYAYDKAFEQQVIGGLGNFQLHLDYAHDDVFEQDIRIAAVPDPLAVVWDRSSVDPTAADAEHVFVIDRLPRRVFKKRYPKAQAGDFDAMSNEARTLGWDTMDAVQLVSFWRMRSHTRTVAMMRDGSIQDVTDIPVKLWQDVVMLDREELPMIREVQRRYAQMHLCSSSDILAGPYDLPVQRLPVFRVPGWEIFIGQERKRWGLVRFARDPQRLHNYWRSTIAEKLVGSPKGKWTASTTAVSGLEEEWRNSHLSDDPLLRWNGEAGQAPVRVQPIDMEPALIEQAGVASQDIRDVLNIHEANLGQQSNEVSGVAIAARQRVGELGSVIYQDNLNAAIEEAGKVINQLIPFVYDTPRMIKVLGEDLVTEKQVSINGASEDSIDITVGKYSVTITTGPSYVTRRMEAREEMMAMVNAMPQVMAVVSDLIVENQDWPGAEKISKRLQSQLPPGMIPQEDLDEEQIAQQQQAAQQAQQEAQVAQQAMQLEMMEKEASARLKLAQAIKAEAEAREAVANAELSGAKMVETAASAELKEAQTAATYSGIRDSRVSTDADAVAKLSPKPAGNGAK